VNVAHGVSDVFVSEELLNVERIFCAPRFQCAFEVSERFEADVHQPRVLELVSYPFSLYRNRADVSAGSFYVASAR